MGWGLGGGRGHVIGTFNLKFDLLTFFLHDSSINNREYVRSRCVQSKPVYLRDGPEPLLLLKTLICSRIHVMSY